MSTTNSNSLDSTSGSSESSVGGDQSGGSLSASTTISNMTAKCHPMPPLDMTDTADSAAPTPPPEMDDQLDGASVSRQSHQLSRPNSLEHYDTNHTIATDETTNTNSNNISEQSNKGQQQSSDGQNENENNAVVSSATVLVASAGESVQQLPSLRIAQSDSSGLSRHYITGTSNSNNNTHNHTTLQKALSVIERKSSLDANTNIINSSGLTTRSPMDVESSVIIQKQLDRIESLEGQLEHIKMERDSLLAENERLCFQLQMMSEAVKQQQQQQQQSRSLDPVSKCDHHHHQPPPPPAVSHCSCGAPLESVSNNSPPVELSTTITGPVCHCDCSSCPALVSTGQESTELAHFKHPHPLDPSLMLSNVSLTNGQDLTSYACPNEQPLDGIRSSKSVSSFSSFKTTVDNYEVNNGTSHEASPHHPHLSNHYLIHNGDKRLASSSLSPCMHPECINPTTVTITSPTSSCQSRHKGVLLRTSAVSSESYISQMLSPVTPTLSPSISKSPLPLSASLNLSPTSATSPLFGYATTSPLHPLSRTARTGGGSSTSLTSATNGATYGNYELSQQLQDKHTSALERKYGGREARDAAIKIQRAFRSYRLQKRFTTLAIQAICHQQLKLKQQKEEEEAHKLRVQQKQQQQQPFLVKEESVIEMPRVIAPKLADTLKVDSMNLAPIDREAMQHRFSRKMSANYALEDLARMQSLQSQHQQQQQSSAQGGSGGQFVPMHQHQTYLTIPRQSSPPVTLVTSYEPVYHPPPSILYNSNSYSNHHHHHHQHHTVTVDIEPQLITKPLKKKTSFSSTSSTASSSSLHASSSSSKPSELTSSNSRLAKESIMLSDHNRLHTTRSQSQLAPQHSTKQRSQKGQQQQQQPYQAGQSGAMSLAPNGAPLGTIHKTSTMSHHLIATNGAPNTVSFAPNVDFVNNLANTTEAVTSSVDAYRKRQYRVGLNLFNKNPSERGIRFLIANGYIEQSEVTETQASTVAHFLLTRKGLSRQMIGEYIAEPAAFNQSVLKYFCSGVNLSGIIVDEALRAFQVHFRFPGEAQKIERLVEAFADRYKECNPGDVLSRDSIFILAFAIIMLNTDLHKPTNIKHRMTPEQWLANLKGVFSEGDLSSQFLLGIYKRIKKQELQTGGDHVTQVLKVQSTIVGKDVPNLCLPHRRLVCYCRLYEIRDLNRREKVGQHQRDVFLFNDLLLITKTTSRSRNGQMAEYQYRSTYSLDGLQVLVFSTPYYPNGIRISRRVDNKIIACFNARNDLDQQRFVDDLQEAINEMDDMEQMRITKSSSLVQLNTLATGKEGNSGAGAHHGQHQQATAQSSTVIASPTDMATSYNSSLNSSVNYGQATNSSNNSNGCATQARASAAIASYPYNPK